MPAARETARLLRVIDGDTVEVARKGNAPVRIRLYGIDAPESAQRGGRESTDRLKKIIGGNKTLQLEDRGRDQYGRTIGVIYAGRQRESCNLQLLRAGHAHVYMVQEPEKAAYYQAEASAKQQRRGVWRQSGKPQPPRVFRQREKTKVQRRNRIVRWIWIALFLGAGLAAALYWISQQA